MFQPCTAKVWGGMWKGGVGERIVRVREWKTRPKHNERRERTPLQEGSNSGWTLKNSDCNNQLPGRKNELKISAKQRKEQILFWKVFLVDAAVSRSMALCPFCKPPSGQYYFYGILFFLYHISQNVLWLFKLCKGYLSVYLEIRKIIYFISSTLHFRADLL